MLALLGGIVNCSVLFLIRLPLCPMRQSGTLYIVFCALALLMLFAFVGYFEKPDGFLMMNHATSLIPLGFWKVFTHGGDGVFAWVFALLLWICRRRPEAILLILAWAISGAIVQISKNFIFPDALRPLAWFEAQHLPLEVPEGLNPHRNNSFPSGHSATAMVVAFVLSLLIAKPWLSLFAAWIGLMLCLSRIALFQHFPVDVLSGAAIGLIALWPAIQLSKWMTNQWPKLKTSNSVWLS